MLINIKYISLYLLNKAYTQSDIKELQRYYDSFISVDAVEFARSQSLNDLNHVLSQLENCKSEKQMETIIKQQSTEIKYFLFERFSMVEKFTKKMNIDTIEIPKIVPIGQAYVSVLNEFWKMILQKVSLKNSSPSDFFDRLLKQSHQNN